MAIQAEGGGEFKLVQRVYDGGAQILCTPTVKLIFFFMLFGWGNRKQGVRG